MAHDLDANSRLSYERFREFERLMSFYPRGTVHAMNPTPLGFCAFALTLFVYSMYMAGATVPIGTATGTGMGLALFYGGLILLLAGLFELREGNNFHALIFCSYAGFWLSRASLNISAFNFISNTYGTDSTLIDKGFGIYYLAWTIFTLGMLISSIRINIFSIIFFSSLLITYTLLTASFFLLFDYNLLRAAGAFGILTAAIAWYGGFASLHKKGENSYFNLPVFSLAPKPQSVLTDKSMIDIRTQQF